MTTIHFILIAAGAFGFAVVLYRELRHDWNAKVIDHAKGWKRRFIWLIPTGVAWSILHPVIAVLWVALLMFGLWWTFFDSIYNAHYNRPLFHVVKPHSNSAVTDRFLYPLPVIVRVIIKIGLIAVSAFMYFKLY